jgi:hypothetical protein
VLRSTSNSYVHRTQPGNLNSYDRASFLHGLLPQVTCAANQMVDPNVFLRVKRRSLGHLLVALRFARVGALGTNSSF